MLRPDGLVKVLDFGLAKLNAPQPGAFDAGAETKAIVRTDTGIVMGTAHYMSPEQARGLAVDARTDVWSLGIVLYEMLAGRPPFEGETRSHVIVSILEKEPPPLAGYAEEAPAELERVVNKTLRKNREERYQTVKELAVDLKKLKQEVEVEARLEHAFGAEVIRGVKQNIDSPANMRAAAISARPTLTSERSVRWRMLLTSRGAIAPAVLATLVIAALIYALGFHGAPVAREPEVKSLAVLPLKSLSKDPNDDYLGLGIADAIITKLSQNGELTVRPISAVRKYANQEVDSLSAAQQLKVDSVLDGTVQRSGDRSRINLNLLRTQDGASIWSDSFDVSMGDIFKLQDDVSQQVASRLRLKLRPQTVLANAHAVNPQAYDYYLRAKFHAGLLNEPENDAAIELLERAVKVDPDFAAAYAELAQEYRQRAFALKPQDRELEERAFADAEKALSLDPDLAEGHIARGLLLWTPSNHFSHDRAVQELRRALELNPNLADAHYWLGHVYNHVGLLDKAETEFQKAVAIDPTITGARFRVGVNLLYQCKYEQALAAFGDSSKFLPGTWASMTAWALFQLGRKEEAAARIEQFLRDHPQDEGGVLTGMEALIAASAGDARKAEQKIKRAVEIGKDYGHFHHTAYSIASAYALLNKRAEAIRWLQFAADNGFPCYPLFECDPNLNNLRQDTRFIAFMTKLKEQWEHYKATL